MNHGYLVQLPPAKGHVVCFISMLNSHINRDQYHTSLPLTLYHTSDQSNTIYFFSALSHNNQSNTMKMIYLLLVVAETRGRAASQHRGLPSRRIEAPHEAPTPLRTPAVTTPPPPCVRAGRTPISPYLLTPARYKLIRVPLPLQSLFSSHSNRCSPPTSLCAPDGTTGMIAHCRGLDESPLQLEEPPPELLEPPPELEGTLPE